MMASKFYSIALLIELPLIEIWTKAALPYKGFSNQKVWVEVLAGYRLPCPDGCPQNVHNTMLQCWNVCCFDAFLMC